MKIFISSVIIGFEALREAAGEAISTLGYDLLRAEDFGSSENSPQHACLEAVRAADLVVLLLGARYGPKQASGLSATHEEYREAQPKTPVLAFVEEGVAYDAAEAAFITEVRDWETGNLTSDFSTADDLRILVTRALHRHVLSGATSALDEKDLLARADGAISTSNPSHNDAQLILSLVPGPTQEVLRPAELEDPSFARAMQQEALFGAHPLLAPEAGVASRLRGDWLVLAQGNSSIELNSTGALVICCSLQPATGGGLGFMVLIEEDIKEQLALYLQFAAAVLDRIDAEGRLSHVVIAAALAGASYKAWRTRAEHAQSPNTVGSLGGSRGPSVVHLTRGVRRRAEIAQLADALAEDLMVLLRRLFAA